MNYDDFIKLLKEANLEKEAFMSLTGTKLGTFNGWGTTRLGRKTPLWVESWIRLYIDNKKKDIVIQALKN